MSPRRGRNPEDSSRRRRTTWSRELFRDQTLDTLIVSNEGYADVVQAVFAAGARGYVLQFLAAIELLKTVEAIVRYDCSSAAA